MKFLLVFVAIGACFVADGLLDVKCHNGGCFELIKHFAELLEERIILTEAILAQAENELTEVVKGEDQNFTVKLKEVDEKLKILLDEIETGVDGGEQSLIGLINSVFDEKANAERLVSEAEIELDGADGNNAKASVNVGDVQEIIRVIQDEINRLLNATEILGPEAFADAFDRSEKFNSNSRELNDVLDEAKEILKDYEDNLREAKRLTTSAMEKFGEADNQLNSTLDEQKKVEDMLEATEDMQLTESELESLKKLAAESLAEAGRVNEVAFDLLDEVAKFELNRRFDEINAKVAQLNNHSDATQAKLKDFAEENAKFLDDMEKTLDAAEGAKDKAEKIKEELDELLETIKEICKVAKNAVDENNSVMKDAEEILTALTDFDLKMEKAKENARAAYEKIPEILKKIEESVKIVDKLENKLKGKGEAANDAKAKCIEAKEKMDFVLGEAEKIKKEIEEPQEAAEPVIEEGRLTDLEATRLSKEADKLEKEAEAEDKIIEPTKKKIDQALTQTPQADKKVEDALATLQELQEEIEKLETLDEGRIVALDAKLTEAEAELKESGLEQSLKNLRGKRLKQRTTIDQYNVEMSMLEYQLSVIKMNAEALEGRCFKRSRLEP